MIPDESARGPRGHGLISALMVDGRVCNGQGERRGGGFIGGVAAAMSGRHRRGALWGVEEGAKRLPADQRLPSKSGVGAPSELIFEWQGSAVGRSRSRPREALRRSPERSNGLLVNN